MRNSLSEPPEMAWSQRQPVLPAIITLPLGSSSAVEWYSRGTVRPDRIVKASVAGSNDSTHMIAGEAASASPPPAPPMIATVPSGRSTASAMSRRLVSLVGVPLPVPAVPLNRHCACPSRARLES
jgi:hypothetical protein